MNTNTNTTEIYTVIYTANGVHKRTRVQITEGYTTLDSIPKILAVKEYSSNDADALAKINVLYTTKEK